MLDIKMKVQLTAFLLLYWYPSLFAQQSHASSQNRRNLAVSASKPEAYLSDLSVRAGKTSKFQQVQYPNIDMYLARGISKITLDINKVASIASPNSEPVDNMVYGPVTIAAAMALLLLGSLGQTYNELASFFGHSTGLNIFDNPSAFQEDFARFLTRLESTTGYDIGHTVNFATGIFIQRGYSLRPEYEQTSRMLYKTNILTMDFQENPQDSQKMINNWVSARTNKKIPMLLTSPPAPHTKAIIASVLYFKSPWEYPFFEGHTKARPFYINGRKSPTNKMAQMMVNGGEFPYYKDTNLGVEIMGFPYKGGRTSMYVILPNDSNAEKLKRLENTITAADIERLVGSTQFTESVILFPKMRLENTLDLTSSLQKLGVTSIFKPFFSNLGLMTSGFMQKEPEAPPFVNSFASRLRPTPTLPPKDDDDERLIFTRFGDQINCPTIHDTVNNITKCIQEQLRSAEITPLQALDQLRQALNANPRSLNPDLYADEVIHKVFIDITESGTEAAAATGISLNRSGGHVTFRVDMPFLFFIYHEETKMILFFGSVKTPTPAVTTS